MSPNKPPAKKPRGDVLDILSVDFDSMEAIKDNYTLYIDDESVPSSPFTVLSNLLKKATKQVIQKLVAKDPSLFSDIKLSTSTPKDVMVKLVAGRIEIVLKILSGKSSPIHTS